MKEARMETEVLEGRIWKALREQGEKLVAELLEQLQKAVPPQPEASREARAEAVAAALPTREEYNSRVERAARAAMEEALPGQEVPLQLLEELQVALEVMVLEALLVLAGPEALPQPAPTPPL